MPASPASASSDPVETALVVSPGWLGDSLMALPAVQAFRRLHPGVRIVLLTKDRTLDAWCLVPAVDKKIVIPQPLSAVVRALKDFRCRAAYILPNSFRSALPVFLAGIPRRRGRAGHWRRALLTEVVPPCPRRPGREHQLYEYMSILAPEAMDDPPETPRLTIPRESRETADVLAGQLGGRVVAFFPGAARGPSKQWPAEYFIALGGLLGREPDIRILVCGTRAERELAQRVARAIGSHAFPAAGWFHIPELAAMLERCSLVVTNDSGGMHLAAAAGAPVLAIFGATDPDRTGPLGPRCRILQPEGARSRDIARRDRSAMIRLASIRPEQVYEAALESLAARPPPRRPG